MLFNHIISTLLLTAFDAKSLNGGMKTDNIKEGELGGAKKEAMKLEKPEIVALHLEQPQRVTLRLENPERSTQKPETSTLQLENPEKSTPKPERNTVRLENLERTTIQMEKPESSTQKPQRGSRHLVNPERDTLLLEKSAKSTQKPERSTIPLKNPERNILRLEKAESGTQKPERATVQLKNPERATLLLEKSKKSTQKPEKSTVQLKNPETVTLQLENQEKSTLQSELPAKGLYKEPDCYGGTAPSTHYVKLPSFLWNHGVYGGCRTSQINIQQGSLICDFGTQMNVELNPRHPKPEDTPYSIRPKLTLFPQDKAFYQCINHVECTKCEYQLICDDCGWMDIGDMRNCQPWQGPGCSENDILRRRRL